MFLFLFFFLFSFLFLSFWRSCLFVFFFLPVCFLDFKLMVNKDKFRFRWGFWWKQTVLVKRGSSDWRWFQLPEDTVASDQVVWHIAGNSTLIRRVALQGIWKVRQRKSRGRWRVGSILRFSGQIKTWISSEHGSCGFDMAWILFRQLSLGQLRFGLKWWWPNKDNTSRFFLDWIGV